MHNNFSEEERDFIKRCFNTPRVLRHLRLSEVFFYFSQKQPENVPQLKTYPVPTTDCTPLNLVGLVKNTPKTDESPAIIPTKTHRDCLETQPTHTIALTIFSCTVAPLLLRSEQKHACLNFFVKKRSGKDTRGVSKRRFFAPFESACGLLKPNRARQMSFTTFLPPPLRPTPYGRRIYRSKYDAPCRGTDVGNWFR